MPKHLLLSWSDRGVSGPVPSHHGKRPSSDPGPLLRLLDSWEGVPSYDSALILCTPDGHPNALSLCLELQSRISSVDCVVLPISDPSDHAQLFQSLSAVTERLDRDFPLANWKRDLVLSAGTPQAQTIWVILVQAGILLARMLQVIPSAFVPVPHPSPVRVVKLDFDGFPKIRALRDEVGRLRAAVAWKDSEIVGICAPIQSLHDRLARVAPTDLPILVLGETGTGKELVARAIHSASARSRGPFIAENCSAFSESLLVSELFGHEAGSFSGAVARHRGLFELAHGGTLLLDEIGDMPKSAQAHLLRVLQEGRLRRVGGESSIRVDVRVIAATHQDLGKLISQGDFRQDLYYRLCGASLLVPALRDRTEDLPLLIDHFLKSDPARKLRLSSQVMTALQCYPWPGNVRQLRSEVLRWKALCSGTVQLDDLSPEILSASGKSIPSDSVADPSLPLAHVVEAAERVAITRALSLSDGNLSRTALALGIDRNTLKRKIAKFRISKST